MNGDDDDRTLMRPPAAEEDAPPAEPRPLATGPREARLHETTVREYQPLAPAAREVPADPTAARGGDTAARELKPPGAPTREVPADPTAARAAPEGTLRLTPEAQSRALPTARFSEGYRVRGRYLLEKLIGQGAMGQVWQARDLLAEEARDRNPRVALKVLNANLEAHPDAFVAMHREATRAQKLAHPNVVTVYVFDRDDASGRAFIAMELLEGRPLDELIRTAGPEGLNRERALPIIRGVAEGLAYAHRRGIVHSDFKPANVFVTRDGTPKILDFGIARAVQAAGTPGGEEADDSGFQGLTPAYAAPEALQGAAASTAEDVFSLGVVATELVTGRHPFNRRSAVDARAAHLERAPLRGLTRREIRAIDKALAFEKAERFADAGAFLRALQGVPLIQKALAAAVGVLLLAALGLWYRSYLQSLPNEPLERLPIAMQTEFRDKVRQGAESLAYLERTRDITASADAAQYFADAYRLHPKDPQAVKGLERAADYAIAWYEKQPDRQEALSELERFRARSDYYEQYRPLQRAIRAAGGK